MHCNDLPILDILVKKALNGPEPFPLAKTAVIYIHHALNTSLSLLEAQFKLGLAPQNTFVLNKFYSECRRVVEDIKNLGVHYQPCSSQVSLGKFSHSFTYDINLLWYKVLSSNISANQMIIMDHGGYALTFIPKLILEKYRVVGIEKTSAGLANVNLQCLPFPIIETASCAAKKILESPLIAEAVVAKLTSMVTLHDGSITCSVIGYGAVGKALTKKLLSMGYKVIVYDNNSNQLKKIKGAIATNELTVAIAFSDYIFGCTGQDIVTSLDIFRFCSKDKTLISCSSEDKEFLSLIQYVQRKTNQIAANPLNDILYRNDVGATIHILRGGFPVNFDESGESVPRKDIELTRSLVLGSALQAVDFFKIPNLQMPGGMYMLDPKLQKFVVNEWLKIQPQDRFSIDIIQKFQNESWIASNSGGTYKPFLSSPTEIIFSRYGESHKPV